MFLRRYVCTSYALFFFFTSLRNLIHVNPHFYPSMSLVSAILLNIPTGTFPECGTHSPNIRKLLWWEHLLDYTWFIVYSFFLDLCYLKACFCSSRVPSPQSRYQFFLRDTAVMGSWTPTEGIIYYPSRGSCALLPVAFFTTFLLCSCSAWIRRSLIVW